MGEFEKVPSPTWGSEGSSDDTSSQRMEQDLSPTDSTPSVIMDNQPDVIQTTAGGGSTPQPVALPISVEMENLPDIAIRTPLPKSRRERREDKKKKNKTREKGKNKEVIPGANPTQRDKHPLPTTTSLDPISNLVGTHVQVEEQGALDPIPTLGGTPLQVEG